VDRFHGVTRRASLLSKWPEQGGKLRAFTPWCDVWVRAGWRVQVHCDDGRARVLNPAGRQAGWGIEQKCREIAARRAPSVGRRRGAVLLHGMLRDPAMMAPAARALEAAGWAVANLGYPSRRRTLAQTAAAASAAARALADDGAEEVSFVGHSLGGLVARGAMARASQDGWSPGRLVLVGSPARGSSVAGALKNFPGTMMLLGASSEVLLPGGAASVPLPRCRGVAVIAGGTGGRGFNPLLPGDNDVTVTVAETRLPEVEDGFLLVRAMHNALPAHRDTIAATLAFLAAGRLVA
jgi:pimeloyl-ACP methyl ester carboxylesterase